MISTAHAAGIVAVASIVTIAIRFFPFVAFPDNKELPDVLIYLSKVLPPAIMGMLIVYCFRNTQVMTGFHGLPEIIATTAVLLSYYFKRQFLISIALGTVVYMILIQCVFE